MLSGRCMSSRKTLMSKQIEFNETARRAMEVGVDKLADAVRSPSTAGPACRAGQVVGDRPSPTTASPSPARSTSRIRSRTRRPAGQVGGHQDQRRRRRRHHHRHQCWRRPSSRPVCATSLLGPNPMASAWASARPPTRCPRRCWPRPPRSRTRPPSPRSRPSPRATREVGELVGEAMTKVGTDGVSRRGVLDPEHRA